MDIIIATDPSTPLNDAHHGRTFLFKRQDTIEEKETKNTEIDEAPTTVSETEPATTVTVKPQKTLEEQIGILKSRKLYIEDETDAMSLRHYSRNMIASLNRYAWVCRINENSYYLKNKELRISANVDILFSHLH